jgi:hypothetical protein
MNIKLGQASFVLRVWMVLTLLSGFGWAAPRFTNTQNEFGFGQFLHPDAVLITKIFLALAWLVNGFV